MWRDKATPWPMRLFLICVLTVTGSALASCGASAGAGGEGSSQISASGAAAVTPARVSAHIVDNPALHGVLLYGGSAPSSDGTSAPLNDTWLWDGSNWGHIPTASAPPASAKVGSMTYDSTHQNVALVTDQSSAGGARTWVFTGDQWAEQAQANTPPLIGMMVADNPALGGLVGWGGIERYDGATPVYSTNLWRWDGARWSGVTVTGDAPGVDDAKWGLMTADYTRGSVVLFNKRTGVVWNWTGSEWQSAQSTGAPAANEVFTLVDDGALRAPLLLSSGGQRIHTWVSGGGRWTELSPGNAAPLGPSASMSVAFNNERDTLLVYIARPTAPNTTTVLNQTWLWDGNLWSQA